MNEKTKAKAYITARVVLHLDADHPTSQLLAGGYLAPQEEAVAYLMAWEASCERPGSVSSALVARACWQAMTDEARELAVGVWPESEPPKSTAHLMSED